MEKRISFNQFQQVKSAARMIDPIRRKMSPIEKKIKVLAEEYKKYQIQIDALEAGILAILGFHVSDLVKKVIEPGVDSKGNPIKTTKYLPTDIVTYDNVKKQYIITVPDEENTNTTVPPTTEGSAGSDFDIDAEENKESEEETTDWE